MNFNHFPTYVKEFWQKIARFTSAMIIKTKLEKRIRFRQEQAHKRLGGKKTRNKKDKKTSIWKPDE